MLRPSRRHRNRRPHPHSGGPRRPDARRSGRRPHAASGDERRGDPGRLQAAWWNSPELKTHDWMPTRNLSAGPLRGRLDFNSAPRSNRSSAPRTVPSETACSSELPRLLDQLDERPNTIVHSDFRADNLLFDDVLHQRSRWSSSTGSWRSGARACSMSQGCSAEASRPQIARHAKSWRSTAGMRRSFEEASTDYTFDQALADYRTCVLICLYYPVVIHAAEEAGRSTRSSAGPRPDRPLLHSRHRVARRRGVGRTAPRRG